MPSDQVVPPDDIHCPQTDRTHLKEAQIAALEQMEEPVAAALHIRHDHRDRRPAADIHVAVADAGLAPDMGPFATETEGDLSVTIEAVARLLRASFEAGADAVQVRVERVDSSVDSSAE